MDTIDDILTDSPANIKFEDTILEIKNIVKKKHNNQIANMIPKELSANNNNMDEFSISNEIKILKEKKTLLETEINILKKQNKKLLDNQKESDKKNKQEIALLKLRNDMLIDDNDKLSNVKTINNDIIIKNNELKILYETLSKKHEYLTKQYTALLEKYNKLNLVSNKLEKKIITEQTCSNTLKLVNNQLTNNLKEIDNKKIMIHKIIEDVYENKLTGRV